MLFLEITKFIVGAVEGGLEMPQPPKEINLRPKPAFWANRRIRGIERYSFGLM